MSIETKVFIRIHNFDCNLEELTSKLQLKPTGGWIKGDPIPNRKQVVYRKQSTWELQSSLADDIEVTDHIVYLLSLIEPVENIFKEIINKYEGELTIVTYTREESYNPGFYFDNSLIKKIADLGLNIDMDLYFSPSTSEI